MQNLFLFIKENSRMVAMVLALIVMVTSVMTAPFFYLNWILGAMIIVLFVVFIFIDPAFDKSILLAAFISCLWLIVPFLNQFFMELKDPQAQIKKLLVFVFNVAFSSALVYYFFNSGHEKRQRLMQTAALVWAFISLMSLVLFYISKPVYINLFSSRDFAGILENRNNYAMMTTLLLAFFVHYRQHWKHRRIMLITTVVLSAMIFLTSSLKGFIGLAFLAFFEGICLFRKSTDSGQAFSKRNKKKILAFVCICIIIIGVLGAVLLTENPISKKVSRVVLLFTAPEELREGESAMERAYFATESIKLIEEHPLTGIGFWNSAYYLIPPTTKAKGLEKGAYSHINYLEMLSGGGIFTFLLYYIPLIFAVILVFKSRKQTDTYSYLLFSGLYLLLMSFAAVTFDIQYFTVIHVLLINAGIRISKEKHSWGNMNYKASEAGCQLTSYDKRRDRR